MKNSFQVFNLWIRACAGPIYCCGNWSLAKSTNRYQNVLYSCVRKALERDIDIDEIFTGLTGSCFTLEASHFSWSLRRNRRSLTHSTQEGKRTSIALTKQKNRSKQTAKQYRSADSLPTAFCARAVNFTLTY